jgi:hypothetical protein
MQESIAEAELGVVVNPDGSVSTASVPTLP